METSTAWFKSHPEVKLIARDWEKLFLQAASAGAPQAKHVVDRIHLQKNFAQTLEKFFGHRRRLLKKVAQRLAGRALPSSKAAVPRQVENE